MSKSEASPLKIRLATDGDGERAASWAGRHSGPGVNPALLPPIGVVCEDELGPAGAVWAYCSCNVGVAFLEFLAMRPGLRLAQSARVGRALMEGIESALKSLGYGILVAYSLPACARYLRSFDWQTGDERAKVAMVKIL